MAGSEENFPYLELEEIHQLGAGETGWQKKRLLTRAAATPVAKREDMVG